MWLGLWAQGCSSSVTGRTWHQRGSQAAHERHSSDSELVRCEARWREDAVDFARVSAETTFVSNRQSARQSRAWRLKSRLVSVARGTLAHPELQNHS